MDAMFPEVRYPNNNKDSSSSSKAVAEETTTPVEGEGSDQKVVFHFRIIQHFLSYKITSPRLER